MHRPYVSQRNPAAPNPALSEEREAQSMVRFARMLRLPHHTGEEDPPPPPASPHNSHLWPCSENAPHTHARLSTKAALVSASSDGAFSDPLRPSNISTSTLDSATFSPSPTISDDLLIAPRVVVQVEWLNFHLTHGYPDAAQHCWVEADLAGLTPAHEVATPRKDLGSARYGERCLSLTNDLVFDLCVRVPVEPGSRAFAHLRSVLTAPSDASKTSEAPGDDGRSELVFKVLSRRHADAGGAGGTHRPPTRMQLTSSYKHSAFSPSLGRWAPSEAPTGPVYEIGRATLCLRKLLKSRRDALHTTLPLVGAPSPNGDSATGARAGARTAPRAIGELGVTVKALKAMRYALGELSESASRLLSPQDRQRLLSEIGSPRRGAEAAVTSTGIHQAEPTEAHSNGSRSRLQAASGARPTGEVPNALTSDDVRENTTDVDESVKPARRITNVMAAAAATASAAWAVADTTTLFISHARWGMRPPFVSYADLAHSRVANRNSQDLGELSDPPSRVSSTAYLSVS